MIDPCRGRRRWQAHIGNAGVSLVCADVPDFRDIASLTKMIFQKPGGFEGNTKGLFLSGCKAKQY
jgi:N-acetylmuramoyl-L-alanine amidase